MGFNVGMPMLGLKRGAAKGNHAGNIRSIVEEMGEERFSTSSTLDRSRSDQNIYFGNYKSGRECVEAMLAEIDEYETEYKKTSYRNRGLRADATVAVAFIVKPEADWINNQTPEDVEKFFEDAHEVLTDLGITSPESERMRVRHLDEGSVHEHYCTLAYDSEGKLRGSKIVNLKTFRKLNREFPKMMQKRGWDMNELTAYDPEEVNGMTPDEAAAYKQEHIEKKKQKRHGLTANEYIAEKEAEKLAALQSEIADLEPKHKKAKQELDDAESKKATVEKETYDAGFKAHTLARDLEQAMGQPTSYRSLDEVVEDAEEHFKSAGEREANLTRREAEINRQSLEMRQKEQEADELIKTLRATAEAPSSKESWMVGWLKEKVPKAYAACEVEYQKFVGTRDRIIEKRNRVSGYADSVVQNAQREKGLDNNNYGK